ncbi:uncharacterized protein LOC119593070 isoform X2 [Penaeus monodon]|uniref:uncharacterized protein LOC119593070 isoform X2 n=1 Tax=Penaeus monodon TaxID=6687 RepID=UPI0018A72E3E|nr:uncharacterized protein LOC119593070 isoform X2 [Penaeus monodon]
METGGAASEHRPSEITQESVEAALRNDKGSDARLVSFTVQECSKKGDNYATFVDGVNVIYSLHETHHSVSYVVKYNPKRFKAFEELSYLVFVKEAMFYDHLVQDIQSQLNEIGQKPLRVPQCYHTSLEENREVIFLEDLRPKGFKMFDRKKSMDVAHTKLVLEELARLHAASYLLKLKTPDLAEKYPILNVDWLNYADDARKTVQERFSDQMDMVKDMLNKVGGYEVAENWLSRNKGRVLEILENNIKGVPPFDVLCHGDCWTNNVLFRYNEKEVPVEVMLLDLQMCRQASPATDITYLFYTSLEGHVRTSNLESFLDIYYSAFLGVTEAGKSSLPFSRQKLRQEYKNRLEYGLLLALLATVIVLCEGDVAEDNEEEFSESVKKVLDKLVSKSTILRPRFLCMFDEMIENGIIR